MPRLPTGSRFRIADDICAYIVMIGARCATTLVMMAMIFDAVHLLKLDDYVYVSSENETPEVPYDGDNQIHSMLGAIRGDTSGRMVIQTNALIDTKYRTLKRNADLINSLLALPKGMNDAGRR